MSGKTKSIIGIIISVLIFVGIYLSDHSSSTSSNVSIDSNKIISGLWNGINSDGEKIKLRMNDGKYIMWQDSSSSTIIGTYSISTNPYHDSNYNMDFYVLSLKDTNSNLSKIRVKFDGKNRMYWADEKNRDLRFDRDTSNNISSTNGNKENKNSTTQIQESLNSNNSSTTKDTSQQSESNNSSVVNDSSNIYTNATYNFTLNMPVTWKGKYMAKEANWAPEAEKTIDFNLTINGKNYGNIFSILILKNQYNEDYVKNSPWKYITTNNGHVIAYSLAEEPSQELLNDTNASNIMKQMTNTDVPQIIKSIKFK